MKKIIHAYFNSIFFFVTVLLIFSSEADAAICSVGGDGGGCLRGGVPLHRTLHRTFIPKKICPCENLNVVSRSNLNSPIVITYEDLLAAYAPQNDLEYYFTSPDSTSQMNIGVVDLVNPQHWIMPSAYLGSNDYGEGIEPSTTPYQSNFPNATHCKIYKYPTEEYFEYYQFTKDAITLVGNVYVDLSTNVPEVDDVSFLMTPLNLDVNTTFVSGDSMTIDYYNLVYHQEISPYGFGTLTTPDGDIEVLALLNNYEEKLYIEGIDPVSITEKVLVFISKDGHQLNLMLSENSPASGNATIDWMEYIRIVYNPNSVSELDNAARKFSLSPNYPNPFNPGTMIRYELKEASNVSLKIYDQLGKEVAELINEEKPAGTYEEKFDGSKLASGIYFCQLKAGDLIATRKLMLMK
ncbi:MAG: T9SS type A sorting domain-containing protein [Ignavibacteriaceae bacterium]|jgi:hypothetical protein